MSGEIYRWSDTSVFYHIGKAFNEAIKQNKEAGDYIDSGLILTRVLNENGFLLVKEKEAQSE